MWHRDTHSVARCVVIRPPRYAVYSHPPSTLVSLLCVCFPSSLQASSFNQDVTSWTVSSVTTMSQMFYSATSFNSSLSGWNASSVTTTFEMFRMATSMAADMTDFNAPSLTTAESMFYGATAMNGNLSGWKLGSLLNCRSMFNQVLSVFCAICTPVIRF